MTEQSKRLLRLCAETELRFVAADLQRRDKPPRRDWYGERVFDPREEHIARLKAALVELDALKTT